MNLAKAQEVDEFAPATQIERIQIGPHPEYTRLLLDIKGPAQYQVSANFKEKRIDLVFDDTSVGPKVIPRKYRDKNLSAIGVKSSEGQVTLTFHLKNANTRLFHYSKESSSQIVLDLKGSSNPFIKTRIGKTGDQESSQLKQGAVEPQEAKTTRIKGLNSEQIQEIVQKDAEDKLKSGDQIKVENIQLDRGDIAAQQKKLEQAKQIDLGFQVAKYILGLIFAIIVIMFFTRVIRSIINLMTTSVEVVPEAQGALTSTELEAIEDEKKRLGDMGA
ncbi:MAG: hypothetical protein QF434_01540, partial [Nitrospinaceae bacterium]|nr:hypothetical protein [Nitrospinaceae bacterium]